MAARLKRKSRQPRRQRSKRSQQKATTANLGSTARGGSTTRRRVAIVGGGCAGIAAAWQLSQLPGYEVSVYERSWRLGGKGASGRDSHGRIIEHGLHVWLGFYENAFKMIRDCYDEVQGKQWGPGRHPEGRLAHARFDDAFFAQPHIGVTGKDSTGSQVVWSGFLPPAKGLPGDDLDAERNPFTLASYLQRCVDLLKALIVSVIDHPGAEMPDQTRSESRSAFDELLDRESRFDPTVAPEVLIERIAASARDGTLIAAAAILQGVTVLERVLEGVGHSPQTVSSLMNMLKALTAQAGKQLRDLVAIDEKLRWKTEIIDIVMTIAVGLYRDRVLLDKQGLDAINDLDYREWLKKHGASETSLRSAFITGIYDLVFAYEGGDRKKPRLAAGVALRGALRMFFTYRGAMFWRMRSGMGDAVFAPLYKVMQLKDRKLGKKRVTVPGVQFYFLHELEKLTFGRTPGGEPFVKQMTFEVDGPRLKTDNPGDEALDSAGCWPESERHLLGPDAGVQRTRKVRRKRKVTLASGSDFDFVIVAMGRDELAAFIPLQAPTDSGSSDDKGLQVRRQHEWARRWASLRVPQQTVATQAAQVWFSKDLKGLGWYRGPAIVSALGLSFDTWADMTHTLPSERAWRASANKRDEMNEMNKARSVAYFCGVLSDQSVAKSVLPPDKYVEKVLKTLLETDLAQLWPAAYEQGKWKTASDIVLHRTFQANILGPARFSLSLPGTIAGRISPLDRVAANMSVAGDWTACGLDAGCVEAAVISGMLAAHAITGHEPALESIVGYDHP